MLLTIAELAYSALSNFFAKFLYGMYSIPVVFPLVTNSLTYIA